MPRFVLLLHACPSDRPRPTHCDLMLEHGESLQTWSLQQLPRDWQTLASVADFPVDGSSNIVETERLADHRLAYLDYEGPVSGDRGSVRRLDSGTLACEAQPLTYTLAGRVIRGEITLQQLPDGHARWRLVYRPEERITDS